MCCLPKLDSLYKRRFPLREIDANSAGDRLVHQRDLLRVLVERDIKLRYRRSYLGILWSLVNPLLQLMVLSFVFSFILPLDIERYPLFLFIGLLPWIWFQASLVSGTSSIVDNRDLIRRPGFTSSILPVVSVSSNMIHFLLSLPVVFLMVLLAGAHIGAPLIALPLILAVQFVFTLALANFLGGLQVTFRDTQHLVGVALLLWFYLSPIFYSIDAIPEQYRAVYALNPMVPIIIAYRDILMENSWPALLPLLVVGALSTIGVLFGHRFLVRTNNRFVEEL